MPGYKFPPFFDVATEKESSKVEVHVVASSFWRIRARVLAARADMGLKVDLNSASADHEKRRRLGMDFW
jgi:hypothetical protein